MRTQLSRSTTQKIFLTYVIIVTIIFFYISGCDAPHNNPLDPDNPDNKLFLIEGKIETASKTPNPIQEAVLFWKNENLFTKTDEKGNYKIQTKNLDNGWLRIEKQGYETDSIFLIRNSKITYLNYSLNKIPTIESSYVYSVVRNKFSKPEYLIYFEITLSDPDSEIDSVFIKNYNLNIYKKLQKVSLQYFEGKFFDYELNLNSLEELIGKDFNFEVFSNKKSYLIGNSNIKRVIKDEIETIAPKNSDTVSNQQILLRWKRFIPGFNFVYNIEIYTDETEPVLQWKKENIDQDEISIIVDTPLNPTADNRFFWVIWAIDEFKNKTRSKPAGFVIK